jgi:hypothetical protein
MFKTRQSVIRKDYSIATNGTHIFDLNLDDMISRIVINPKVTNPNAYVAVGHPDEIITKIEIVDGSDVIVSLDAMQAKAMAFYGAYARPVSAMNYMALQWSFSPICIYFGRYLGDPKYMLDPNQFNNLQIKISTVIAAAMTGTTVGYIDIVADLLRKEAFQPEGFLSAKELEAITIVASAVHYTDLPSDLPIRQLLGVCFSDTQAPEYQVASFELYEAQKKNLILDYDMEDYQSVVQSEFRPFTEKIYGQALTTDRNFWITPAFERVAVLNDYGEANSVITPESTGGQKAIISAEANAIFEGIVHGWAPHGSCPYVYPLLDDEEGYWNVREAGSGTLRINFHADADTTPTYDVCVQQLRKY